MADRAGNDGKRGDGWMSGVMIVILVGAVAALILGGIPLLSHLYSLNIKSRTVGDGQHAAKDELLQAIQTRYPKLKTQNPDSEIPEGAIPVGAEDLVLSSKPPKRGRSIRLHPRPQPHQHCSPEQGV